MRVSDNERRHHGWALWVLWEALEEIDDPRSDMEREGWRVAAHDNECGGGERPTISSSPWLGEYRIATESLSLHSGGAGSRPGRGAGTQGAQEIQRGSE